jgi:hypothetical protein
MTLSQKSTTGCRPTGAQPIRPLPRPRWQGREHPAPVLDRDLKLVASRKTRSSSQPLDLAAKFSLASEFEVNAALVRFEDGLRFALALVPPGGGLKIHRSSSEEEEIVAAAGPSQGSAARSRA